MVQGQPITGQIRKFSSGYTGAPEYNDDQFEGIVAQRNVYVHQTLKDVNLDYNIARQQTSMDDKLNIVRICMTGGPCAGKTTAIAEIKQELT